ncbi:hypothetical protein KEJ17_05180 [Candidatus Bathyarchaeota archaeon]|nr:hypothetical protein [Candidatus Bathyarchaeota archaeon]
MKIYSVKMRVESPLICTEEQIGNVLRHSGACLKGHTLRGGFLGPAYHEYPDEVIEESRNPQLMFHPAYPVFEGLNAEPAHAFTYSCKICGATEEKDPYEALSELGEDRIPEVMVCRNDHIFSIKTLAGSLVVRKNGRFEKKDSEFTSVKSIGINRFLKGAEHKMLYEYIALSPGSEFRSIIVDLGNRMEKLKLVEKNEIRIGRGVTRGFGRVSIKISLEKDALDEESERIARVLQKRNGIIILRALSTVCRLKKVSKGISTEPFPNITDEWLKPVEFSILNGNAAITSLEGFSGFSNVSKLPVPRLVGAGAGSLFFYKTNGNCLSEASRNLAENRFTGFGPFSCSGLNIMEVYDVE